MFSQHRYSISDFQCLCRKNVQSHLALLPGIQSQHPRLRSLAHSKCKSSEKGHNGTFVFSGSSDDFSVSRYSEEVSFLYTTERKGPVLGHVCIVYMSVLSAVSAMSPIVPGRGRQASYPNRPSLLQQLWTSPHLSSPLLSLSFSFSPPPTTASASTAAKH